MLRDSPLTWNPRIAGYGGAGALREMRGGYATAEDAEKDAADFRVDSELFLLLSASVSASSASRRLHLCLYSRIDVLI